MALGSVSFLGGTLILANDGTVDGSISGGSAYSPSFDNRDTFTGDCTLTGAHWALDLAEGRMEDLTVTNARFDDVNLTAKSTK